MSWLVGGRTGWRRARGEVEMMGLRNWDALAADWEAGIREGG